MKNTIKLFGILVFVLALGGCSGDDNNTITQAQSFISGTFGGMSFFVDPLSNSRAAGGNLSQLQGRVKDGNNIYGITGIYDEETGNFFLSGGSADAGFQIYGFHSGDDFIGTGYNRKKTAGGARSVDDTSSWDEFSNSINFNNSGDPGAVNTSPATGLPSNWFGKWDYCKDVNAGAVEEFFTSWGGPGDYCLVITPQGMRIWINIELLLAHTEEWKTESGLTGKELEAYINSERELLEAMSYDINVLEVEMKSDTEFHVLVSIPMREHFIEAFGIEKVYQKIKFTLNQTGLRATLAIIEEFEDEYEGETYYGYSYFTDDINEARGATDFRVIQFVAGMEDELLINANTLDMTRWE